MQHIWIFQLEAQLESAQEATVLEGLQRLVESWKAHGAPVPGQAEIRYSRFVQVQATPGTTSGCSIDSMTKGVRSLLEEHGLTLLEPNFVFYRDAEGGLVYEDFQGLSKKVREGVLGPDTVIFDTTMNQSSDLSKWEVPLKASWLKRFLPKAQQA